MQVTIKPKVRATRNKKSALKLDRNQPKALDQDVLNASTGELNPAVLKRSLIQRTKTKSNNKESKSEAIQFNGADATQKDNETLDPVQFSEVASQLESVRLRIFRLLINNDLGRSELAKEYLFCVEHGESPSELFCLNRSELRTAQSGHQTKHQTAKQIETKISDIFQLILKADPSRINEELYDQIQLLHSIHFLPVFLLQVSHRVRDYFHKYKTKSVDPAFVRQLGIETRQISKARNAMVNSNLGLVKYMSRQYRTLNMSPEDLYQEGVIGLMKAVDRFDHEREFRFSTYASYWVRQTITRSMGKHEKLIRIPINLAPKAPAVFQMADAKLLENNRLPSVEELSKLCNMTEYEVSTILSFYRPTISLDVESDDDSKSTTMMDVIEQDQFPSAINAIAESTLKDQLSHAVNSLPEKEACVIRCRYGLENQNEMTLQDIANTLQVTRERVRQIQNSGLKKLNLKFGDQLNAFLDTD